MKHLKFFGIILLVLLSTAALCQPVINRMFRTPEEIGLYEKLELPLNITAVFANPFDPDEVNITATFKAPSGKEWKVPGFYSQAWLTGFKVPEHIQGTLEI